MNRQLILVTLCSCALACWGSDDEVHFKPKTYAPRQTLRDSSYRESVYTPSSTSQPVGKRAESPKSPSRWNLFSRDKKLETPKKLVDVPEDHDAAYKQQQTQISVPTIKADARDIPEKKPYQESDKKLTDAGYMIKEGLREKDPMLTPRQGIKAPAPTPESESE